MVLEKNVNHLNFMYHQIATQRASLTVDLQMKDKDLTRKINKIEELERQITNFKEDANIARLQADKLKDVVRNRLPDAETILKEEIFTQAAPTYFQQTKVVKPLRGGGASLILNKAGRKQSNVSTFVADKIEEVPEDETLTK